jgi:small GTP-binding protein
MKKIKIALEGNPNSGKTSIFNALTGTHQKVGNWPGVTVEKKEGYFEYGGFRIDIVDLPGIYSLSAASIDEKIARDFLMKEKPDVAVCILDSSNLERNI